MHIFQFTQHLIHFLFPIACGFTDKNVCKIGIWTLLCQGKTITGFNQRAKIFRKLALSRTDSLIACATQSDSMNVSGIKNLAWRKSAEHSSNFPAGILNGFCFQKAIAPGFGKFLKRRGQLIITHFSLPSSHQVYVRLVLRRWHQRNAPLG